MMYLFIMIVNDILIYINIAKQKSWVVHNPRPLCLSYPTMKFIVHSTFLIDVQDLLYMGEPVYTHIHQLQLHRFQCND